MRCFDVPIKPEFAPPVKRPASGTRKGAQGATKFGRRLSQSDADSHRSKRAIRFLPSSCPPCGNRLCLRYRPVLGEREESFFGTSKLQKREPRRERAL